MLDVISTFAFTVYYTSRFWDGSFLDKSSAVVRGFRFSYGCFVILLLITSCHLITFFSGSKLLRIFCRYLQILASGWGQIPLPLKTCSDNFSASSIQSGSLVFRALCRELASTININHQGSPRLPQNSFYLKLFIGVPHCWNATNDGLLQTERVQIPTMAWIIGRNDFQISSTVITTFQRRFSFTWASPTGRI